MKNFFIIITPGSDEGYFPTMSSAITAALINLIGIPAQVFGYAYLITSAVKLAWG